MSKLLFSRAKSSADRVSNERLIKEHLRDIMRTEDLDNLTSKMVRRVGGRQRGRNSSTYDAYENVFNFPCVSAGAHCSGVQDRV